MPTSLVELGKHEVKWLWQPAWRQSEMSTNSLCRNHLCSSKTALQSDAVYADYSD